MITQADLDEAREAVRDCVIKVRDFHLSFRKAMYSGGRLRENPGEGWEVVIEELATAYEKARGMLWNGPPVRQERKRPYGPPVERHPGELADAIFLAGEDEAVESEDSSGQTIKARSCHELAVLIASRVLSATLFTSDGPITITVEGARNMVRYLHDDEREWKPVLEEVPQFECKPVLIGIESEWKAAVRGLAAEVEPEIPAGRPKRTRRGPKPASPAEIQRDGQLKARWDKARGCGFRKRQFCEDEGISVADLENCLGRVRKRENRAE